MDNEILMKPWEKNLLLVLLGFVVCMVLMISFQCTPQPALVRVEEHRDTLLLLDTVIVQQSPIAVRRAPATVRAARTGLVVYRDSITHDTILISEPFIASMDTIIAHDTISARMEFPPPTLSVLLRRAPDSIRIETRTITLTRETVRDLPLLEKLGYSAIGFVVGTGTGYVIGTLTK